MRRRLWIWILLCLLCLAGAWFFWHQPANTRTRPSALPQVATPTAPATSSASNAPKNLTAVSTNGATSAKTKPFAFRLSNTTRSLDQLVGDRHAILLENALIDTTGPLNLSIPKNLQSPGDPGAYIVQARGPIDNAFRAMLARSGAEIVSYIPNDAYLVRAPAGVANGLGGNPQTQAVIPFEPYYKISSSMPVTVGQKTLSSAPMKTNRAAGPSLLALAVKQSPLPAGTCLTLGLFKNGAAATVAQIEKLGGQIVARDNSPFGPVVRVQPPADWVALAALPGVQIVEPYHKRVHANDLSRATVGVAADTQVATNYLGLSGSNVLVEVNDSGIDATHPDFGTGANTSLVRVFGDSVNLLVNTLVDTNGHGTHVAGTIAGSGYESTTVVTNAEGSIMPGTNWQFRGMAPLATLLAMDWNDSDQELQEAAAQTNALISNNSWNYGDNAYDLAAASYDAAVRDALPGVTGSQPVLFVFSAGNDGNGDDSGGSGNPDTILSPATAKNVITVGALEQLRNITNIVTDLNSNQSEYWYPETDTSYEVAAYSSRGNVGVGTEGTYGRFKPDVVAPGSFVISTRSEQWNTNAYYNPTNDHVTAYDDILEPGSFTDPPLEFYVYKNAVQVMIEAYSIGTSTNVPLPIYVWPGTDPNTVPPVLEGTSFVSLPPVPSNAYWQCAVSNTTSTAVIYEFIVDVQTTNDLGNYYQVLEGMNDSLGGWYRYESGTSMAAADASGVLALMQDYFTNTLHATPSPALLKAMLINGARVTSTAYNLQVQNGINNEGWGLINLPDSLPPGITTNVNNSAGESMLMIDQSPANALATGDSHQYQVTIANTNAQTLPLRFTLAWTDPPGDPNAAIKLVNNLVLVVTNLDDPANPVIYYGNDIAGDNIYNTPETTNTPNYDSINNVENVYLPAGAGTNFSVTVQGYLVNVNAVTAQTNNVVQDYALVLSYGEGEVTNALTVTDVGPGLGIISNPTTDQQITYVVNPNAPLLDQLAGASTPLLGTNTILLTTNGTELNGIQLGGTNLITLGMTNQWHFYVMTNPGPADFTNAAFITFDPYTLSIPRMGVFSDSEDATRPEADIDLYVSSDPTLMNLNPVAISNADKSVGRGGTEFVYYTNSAQGKVYYVGVYSEDQQAAEFGFMPIFTDIPFSQMNSNGDQVVNGLVLPANIPDDNTVHPGIIFALAIYPMEIQRVVVTTSIAHQNFGDLIGGLAHGQMNGLSQTVVLNNHDSLGNTYGPPTRTFIYDDSGQNNIFGSQTSDGPGSLNNSVGQQGIGPWILTEVDDSLTQTGAVTGFNLLIEPHQDLGKGVYGTAGPMSWWYGYIDVPSGTASLTISATNLTQPPSMTPPLDLYVNVGSIPTLTDTNEFGPAGLTNPPTPPPAPGNSIYIGSPAPGRYWVGLYNGSVLAQNFYLIANLGTVTPPAQVIYTSAGPVPLLDDAVTSDYIYVTADQNISSVDVGLRVNHPRVSDLVFHLISPSGTRVLLVENRGGTTTSGMGGTIAVTNIVPVSSSGGAGTTINVINVAMDTGTLSIFYNFYTLPDEMVIDDQSGAQIFDSGMISGSGEFNVAYANSSFLTIVMNPPSANNNEGPGDLWDYTVSALQARQTYLVLTENTNLTTTPIKFAPTPFVSAIPVTTNVVVPGWYSGFEGAIGGTPLAGSYFAGGWYVNSGSVDVLPTGVFGSTAFEGTNYLDINGNGQGTISTNVTTVAGQTYQLSFAYAPNPDARTHGTPTVTVQLQTNSNPLLTLSITKFTNTWANLGWATTSLLFTATSPSTLFAFVSQTPGVSGVLLDAIGLAPLTGNNGFEGAAAGDYAQSHYFDGWFVSANQVTVISNAALAYSGTNLLALADGQISRILPTIPGTTYTLSFAYRGPGAVALWRGESNANDSISANNPATVQDITYTNGVVGQAMVFNGTSSYIQYPASSSLDVGTSSSGFTLDTWVYWGAQEYLATLFEWNTGSGSGDASVGVQFAIAPYNGTGGPASGEGDLTANLEDTTSAFHPISSLVNVVAVGSFQHVALTYDRMSGNAVIYRNGVVVANTNLGTAFTPQTSFPLYLGWRAAGNFASPDFNALQGYLDEPTIYNRPLSASEIIAIYNQGTNGMAKYNTNAPAGIAQGLAEAQLTLNGAPQPIFFGNDTNWQTATYSFTATTTNTPLQITGLEPGMLLDSFVMTTIPTNNYDLYYQPEESLDLLDGENAEGQWQLEIQDDRVGATNPAPSLVSWQLRFNFPYTPPTITTLTNGQTITSNTVPPGGIAYYLVQVPTNADISTNILLNTTGPLNLLFDAFNPPTGILPQDYLILSAPTGGGLAILNTTSIPTNFAAGGIYYLGVQNLNSYSVNYDIQVFFHLVPPPLSLPQLPELLAIANQLFTVTNSATGGVPPLTYVLTSSVYSGPAPVIDTNGVITWTPATSQAPAVYTLTNIVTDTTTLLTATDIFHVLVVLTNGQPAFPGAEGAGGFAIGGRGGDVYHVVNLNDSGPGSLRNGIQSTFGSRTIVFDVSGAINLYSPLQINNPYFTIAGQTAPGAGITIQGLTFSAESVPGLDSAHDEVVRFVRCRPGDIYAQYFQGDSFHFIGVTNSIADHISASWSLDTVLSTTYSTNVTVQWSMIAQPLDHSAYLIGNGNAGYQEHGYGSLIRYGSGAISYLHNLYADNYSYNPRVGDDIQLDFINNVVCNWGAAAGLNEDDTADNPGGYTNYLNYRGNYFIAGSNSVNPNIAFASGVTNATFTQIYEATNLIDTNAFNIVLEGTNTDWNMFSGLLTQLASPTLITNGIPAATNDPAFAYEQVLAFAGASVAGATAAGSPAAGTSLLRDPVDTNIVANVRNKSGQIIDFISSNSFPGVYLGTNFGATYSGYSNAAVYWVAQGLTNFVGVNPWPVLDSAPQPLDSDGDGIPDYWEITLAALGTNSMNPAVPNNNHSNPDGYTDLEHYINWLAAPHALTVSNTPVDVNLYAVVGRTGNLSFGVTNGTNGTVTLGTNGYTATFMPTNDYFGFASFGFSVTNLATTNGFDVTVSVMVSITNIITSSLPLTNAVPQTNTLPAGSFTYYLVTVPYYAQLATNILISPSAPLNLWFSRAGFPTGTNTGDYILLTNSLGGSSLLGITTNFMPTNIIPGGTYYLGVQNLNGFPVNFGLEVDFYPPAPLPPPTPVPVVITITSITYTNINGTNGFLLQWQGPTNYQYQIQWTTNLLPLIAWNTVLNPTINVSVTATNGHYSFFDDGSLTGGPALMKFYRILAYPNLGLITNPGPATNTVLAGGMSQVVVAVPANAIAASNFLMAASGPLNVWFNQTNPPTGDTNAGDFLMLSATNSGVFVLTSNSVPPLVPGTNYYLGFQNPGANNVLFIFQVAFGYAPTNAVSNFSITATNGGVWLQWNGLTNYQYQVQWTTNLAPPAAWNTISNIVLTSTTGIFTFFDDGSLTGGFGPVKFYRLIAWPFMTPIPQTLSISSVTVTSVGGTNDLVLRWSAPTNYQYGIQWTTNVSLPFSNWSVIPSPVLTLTNGVYTFIDNGQTGPPASAKFFRLYEYP
ncbi:MAG: S8 family serine peptidase [Verrucomicrobiota bacterium]|jgi:subtilisin-like proprotein convertase family protein